MLALDKRIAQGFKEDIVHSVLSDEMGEFIDSLANLETDKDIIERCSGGEKDE